MNKICGLRAHLNKIVIEFLRHAGTGLLGKIFHVILPLCQSCNLTLQIGDDIFKESFRTAAPFLEKADSTFDGIANALLHVFESFTDFLGRLVLDISHLSCFFFEIVCAISGAVHGIGDIINLGGQFGMRFL